MIGVWVMGNKGLIACCSALMHMCVCLFRRSSFGIEIPNLKVVLTDGALSS